MPPITVTENEIAEHKYEIVEKDGKLYERSQQDGELYSKPTIGIIYPPPEVRNIVDRTANFVARNGPEFEDRIRENEADNPKFNFLNPNDPYHAYYQHKSKEYKEGAPHETAPPVKELQKVTLQPKQKQLALVIEPIIPKEPPPVFEYTSDPPSISAIDLDIVRLTAQFIAKNGKTFLTNLMNREQRNFQFDFLRPQHSLFQYFTRLVEQYTKILLPPSDLSEELDKDRCDPWKVLDRVKYRVEWQKYQDREKKKVQDEKERERVSFAQIDWHDFVVVETVNFREDESANLPPPVSKEQLGARLLAQERAEKKKDGDEDEGPTEGEAMDVEIEEDDLYQPFVIPDQEEEDKADSDMEEESDEEEEEEEHETTKEKDKTEKAGDKPEKEVENVASGKKDEILPPPPLPPLIPGVTAEVRRDYDPKAPKPPPPSMTPLSEKFLISPLTGEKIPVENMAAHMKISLLDPRWKEQNEKLLQEKRLQEQVFAEGVHIGDTLRQLAERRSDIFGAGAEETAIGRKLGEDEQATARKKDKEIWDGHSGSMERTTKAAHANITLDEQIEAIHRSKGLLPSLDASKIGPTVPKPAMNKPFDGTMPPVFISSQPPQPLMKAKIFDIPPLATSSVAPPPMPPPMPLMSQPPIPPPRVKMAPIQPPPIQPPPIEPPPIEPPPIQPPPIQPPPIPQPVNDEDEPSPIQPPPQPLIMPPPPIPLIQPPPITPLKPPMPPPQLPVMPPPRPMTVPERPSPLLPSIPDKPPTLLPSMPAAPPSNVVPPQATINFLQSPGMPPPMPPLQVIDDEPPAKKSRLEPATESDLMPEMEYLKKNARIPITFRVQVPDIPEKSEWKCNGQMLRLCLPLTDQCSVIKSKIYDETQMPAGKQKLQMGNFFLKDSNSIAFYNVSSMSVVQLQVKERGGRKK